jgi:hypothetical protein
MRTEEKRVLPSGQVVKVTTLERWAQEQDELAEARRLPLTGMFLAAEKRAQRRARKERALEREQEAVIEVFDSAAVNEALEQEAPVFACMDEPQKGTWEARSSDEERLEPDVLNGDEDVRWVGRQVIAEEAPHSQSWAETQAELQDMLRLQARLVFLRAAAFAVFGLLVLGLGAVYLWQLR